MLFFALCSTIVFAGIAAPESSLLPALATAAAAAASRGENGLVVESLVST